MPEIANESFLFCGYTSRAEDLTVFCTPHIPSNYVNDDPKAKFLAKEYAKRNEYALALPFAGTLNSICVLGSTGDAPLFAAAEATENPQKYGVELAFANWLNAYEESLDGPIVRFIGFDVGIMMRMVALNAACMGTVIDPNSWTESESRRSIDPNDCDLRDPYEIIILAGDRRHINLSQLCGVMKTSAICVGRNETDKVTIPRQNAAIEAAVARELMYKTGLLTPKT